MKRRWEERSVGIDIHLIFMRLDLKTLSFFGFLANAVAVHVTIDRSQIIDCVVTNMGPVTTWPTTYAQLQRIRGYHSISKISPCVWFASEHKETSPPIGPRRSKKRYYIPTHRTRGWWWWLYTGDVRAYIMIRITSFDVWKVEARPSMCGEYGSTSFPYGPFILLEDAMLSLILIPTKIPFVKREVIIMMMMMIECATTWDSSHVLRRFWCCGCGEARSSDLISNWWDGFCVLIDAFGQSVTRDGRTEFNLVRRIGSGLVSRATDTSKGMTNLNHVLHYRRDVL